MDETITILFDIDAAAEVGRWCIDLYGRRQLKEEGAFLFHISKYDALLGRLCLIFHFLEHGADGVRLKVNLDTVKRVQKFIDHYLEPHARTIYGIINSHINTAGAKRIAQWLQEEIKTYHATPNNDKIHLSVTEREVTRKGWREFKDDKDGKLMRDTLKYLVNLNWLNKRERPPGVRGGRTTVDYIVNTSISQFTFAVYLRIEISHLFEQLQRRNSLSRCHTRLIAISGFSSIKYRTCPHPLIT